MGTEPSYDLDLLPSVQMQKEMREFLKYRGQQLGAEKFYTERRFYIIYVNAANQKRQTGKFFGLGQRKMEAADENMAFTAGIAPDRNFKIPLWE